MLERRVEVEEHDHPVVEPGPPDAPLVDERAGARLGLLRGHAVVDDLAVDGDLGAGPLLDGVDGRLGLGDGRRRRTRRRSRRRPGPRPGRGTADRAVGRRPVARVARGSPGRSGSGSSDRVSRMTSDRPTMTAVSRSPPRRRTRRPARGWPSSSAVVIQRSMPGPVDDRHAPELAASAQVGAGRPLRCHPPADGPLLEQGLGVGVSRRPGRPVRGRRLRVHDDVRPGSSSRPPRRCPGR